MRTSRVFRVIWRIDGVLLLLAFLLLGGAALVAVISTALRDHRTDTPPPVAVAQHGEQLFFGSVEQVEGSPFVLLPLEVRRHGSKLSSGSPYEGSTRNLLFYDVATGSAHWLRADHGALIVEHELLRMHGAAQHPWDRGEKGDPVRWIRYELVTADTDRDGSVTAEDAHDVAVSGPGGEGFAAVVGGVDEVLGYAPVHDGTLTVFFRRSQEEFAGVIDLAAKKLRRTVSLPKH
jgi:hypothetical protein